MAMGRACCYHDTVVSTMYTYTTMTFRIEPLLMHRDKAIWKGRSRLATRARCHMPGDPEEPVDKLGAVTDITRACH